MMQIMIAMVNSNGGNGRPSSWLVDVEGGSGSTGGVQAGKPERGLPPYPKRSFSLVSRITTDSDRDPFLNLNLNLNFKFELITMYPRRTSHVD